MCSGCGPTKKPLLEGTFYSIEVSSKNEDMKDKFTEAKVTIKEITKEKYEEVGDVRGLGSMLAVEFVKTKAEKEPNGELVSKVIQNALQMGLMLENAGTHGNVIRFLVPLCVTDEQLEKGFEIFETALVKAKSDK